MPLGSALPGETPPTMAPFRPVQVLCAIFRSIAVQIAGCPSAQPSYTNLASGILDYTAHSLLKLPTICYKPMNAI